MLCLDFFFPLSFACHYTYLIGATAPKSQYQIFFSASFLGLLTDGIFERSSPSQKRSLSVERTIAVYVCNLIQSRPWLGRLSSSSFRVDLFPDEDVCIASNLSTPLPLDT